MHKYRAVRTEIEGKTFASKAEATRYAELLMLAKAGQITGLVLQPKYALHCTDPSGKQWRIGHYIADFAYIDKSGCQVIEDVKGFITQMFKWKRRHVEAEYGIAITEIRR